MNVYVWTGTCGRGRAGGDVRVGTCGRGRVDGDMWVGTCGRRRFVDRGEGVDRGRMSQRVGVESTVEEVLRRV